MASFILKKLMWLKKVKWLKTLKLIWHKNNCGLKLINHLRLKSTGTRSFWQGTTA